MLILTEVSRDVGISLEPLLANEEFTALLNMNLFDFGVIYFIDIDVDWI